MKIAILGSAPSSAGLAPFNDPTWQIWGCSPGLYYIASRVDAWYELHRWEPGVVGKPDSQRPWFTPEYVAWMGRQKLVWMAAQVPEIPGSQALPVLELTRRWGTFFFTSSMAWMLAMAINQIIAARSVPGTPNAEEAIGLWGVDMCATEEYGYQRAGCQHFICLAHMMGIRVIVPPESDLLRPMPLYGIDESSHWAIKNTARKRELDQRLANVRATKRTADVEEAFVMGALDDLEYQIKTWTHPHVAMTPHAELVPFMQGPKAE